MPFQNLKLFKCPKLESKILKKLEVFFTVKELSDVVLIAERDNVHLYAHRVILSATSEYFRATFRNGFQESKDNIIYVKECDGETLKLVISFMYTQTIELSGENIENVFTLAHFLQMETLVNGCCDFMVKQLDVSNCLGIALFAEQYNCKELQEKATSFFFEYFEEVCETNEFFELNEEQLRSFITSDDIYMSSEETFFLKLVEWVEYDKPNREHKLLSLMSLVHFPSLTPKFIIDQRLLICKSLEYYHMIYNWLEWHMVPVKRETLLVETKRANSIIGLVHGKHSVDLMLSTHILGSFRWTHQTIPLVKEKRLSYCIIVINKGKELVFAGGISDGESTGLVQCLHIETKTWTVMPPMLIDRVFCAGAFLNGDLYVVGGQHNYEWSSSVEKYDFTTETWTLVASNHYPLRYPRLVSLDGLLYAISCADSKMECYNPTSNEWVCKEFEDKFDEASFCAFRNHIYLIGGRRRLKRDCEVSLAMRYDPSIDRWMDIAPPNFERRYARCVTLNNRLIVMEGGVNQVEQYNPDTNEWKTISAIPEGMWGGSEIAFTM